MTTCCLILSSQSANFSCKQNFVSFFQCEDLVKHVSICNVYVHLTVGYAAGSIHPDESYSFHLTLENAHLRCTIVWQVWITCHTIKPFDNTHLRWALWLTFSLTGQLWLSHSLIMSFLECQLMGYCQLVINGSEAYYSYSTPTFYSSG